MYASFCKRHQLISLSTLVRVLPQSKPQFNLLSREIVVRSFSTSLDKKQSFTVSYLVSSCGVSLETAESISKKVHFTNPKKPDSVLELFRNYGFNDINLISLISKYPRVLVCDSEKIILPKFKFMRSIGISSNDLVKLVLLYPTVLRPSLENRIIPFYDFLKSIVGDDKNVSKVFMRLANLSGSDLQKTFVPNIGVLRDLGVPKSSIFHILISVSSVVYLDRVTFEKRIKEVLNMGYDPKGSSFIHAINLWFSYTKLAREHKLEIYKRWGWSDTEMELALKKYPVFMMISEEKIMKTMDFLINKMGYLSSYIAKYPYVLCYTLEKRIIPRCLVVKVLLLKGKLKNLSLCTILSCPDKEFLKKYISKYQEVIPELLNIYQGKTNLKELGFSEEEIRRSMAL